MKNPKTTFVVLLMLLLGSATNQLSAQEQEISFALVTVHDRALTKKLNVAVDLGDTAYQKAEGERYSELLTDKKSYAAVLNYMTGEGYELVETLTKIGSVEGSGGTTGIVFLLKKKRNR